MKNFLLFAITIVMALIFSIPSALLFRALYFQHFVTEFPSLANTPFIDWLAFVSVVGALTARPSDKKEIGIDDYIRAISVDIARWTVALISLWILSMFVVG